MIVTPARPDLADRRAAAQAAAADVLARVEPPAWLATAGGWVWVAVAAVAGVTFTLFGWWGVGIIVAVVCVWMPYNRRQKELSAEQMEISGWVVGWAEQIRTLVLAGVDMHHALREASISQTDGRFRSFASDLQVSQEPQQPLRTLASRLANEHADLIIGVLIAAETETVGSLADVLDDLCEHLRDEMALVAEVDAQRQGIRTEKNMTAIVAVLLLVMLFTVSGMASFYDDLTGQLTLLFGCGAMFGALLWMGKLERISQTEGFRLRGEGHT